MTENSDSGFKLWLRLNGATYPNFPMYLLCSQLKNQSKKKTKYLSVVKSLCLEGLALFLLPHWYVIFDSTEVFRSYYSQVLLRTNTTH